MASHVSTLDSRKRVRRTFGQLEEVTKMPNLIDVQRSSYDTFLQMDIAGHERVDLGLQLGLGLGLDRDRGGQDDEKNGDEQTYTAVHCISSKLCGTRQRTARPPADRHATCKRGAIESETPEQKAAREALKKELAAQALGLGKDISSDSEKEADEKGRDGLLAKPVTQTLKESMTVENYDEDITKYDDKALGSKLNLSTTEVEKGAPKNNKGDKWREQYRQAEDAAGAAE